MSYHTKHTYCTWYFQQQKIKPSSMKAKFPLLGTDVFLKDHLNEVMEQGHQRVVGNAVLHEEGPNALGEGRTIRANN